MSTSRTAISLRASLGILYEAGIEVEKGYKMLQTLKSVCDGDYYHADEVLALTKQRK